MMRAVATCGWLTAKITRPIEASRLGRLGGRRVGVALAGLLLVVAVAIVAAGYADPQPQDATVEQVLAGGVTHPDGWIRLRGRIFELEQPPTNEPGEYGLLVDRVNPLRAIVLRPADASDPGAAATVTGHLRARLVSVEEELPVEATVFGTPPVVVGDQLVELDPTAHPERVVLWPVGLGLAAVAVVLAIGLLAGYPVFRAAREVDVIARPLSPGERLPAAVAGRIGERQLRLEDPAEALLVAARGERGPVLMLQLLAAGGPAPPPVAISSGSSSGTVGYVHTTSETVPALAVRADGVEAVILFARNGERDRAAAMVGVRR